ncbi:MAG: PH domain-containing protein [Clostridium sp.]
MALFNEDEKKNALNKATREVESLLLEGEEIEETYLLENDYLSFTNKRVVFVDNDPSKMEVTINSLPYSKIAEVGLVKNNRVNIYTGEILIYTVNGKYAVKLNKEVDIIGVYNRIYEKINL